MKKIFLLFLCASYTLILSAQITLTTEKNAPRIGDRFTSYLLEDVIIDVGNGGINQSWDFSEYIGRNFSTALFLTASEGSNPSRYPGANIVQKQEWNDIVETYISTTTGISIIGVILEEYGEIIENRNIADPREVVKFPLSYGTKYNESFSGEINYMGNQLIREGSIVIEADGYGTLTIPSGTFTNVLRIKVTNIYSDKFMGIPVFDYTDVSYMWYGDNNRAPLATYNQMHYYTNFSYISKESVNTSKNDIRTTGALALYPNPVKAGEKITLIKDDSNNEIGWQLLTIGGHVIGSGIINSTESFIPTSQLSSGIYLIKLTGNNLQTMQKLIVE